MESNGVHDLHPRVIRTTVRPYRVVHLLDAEASYDTIRKTVELCCMRWGGVYRVCVPFTGSHIDDHWWRLIEWYDPDLICSWDPIDGDLRGQLEQRLLPFGIVDPSGPSAHRLRPESEAYWLASFATLHQAGALVALGAKLGPEHWSGLRFRQVDPASPWRAYLEPTVGVAEQEQCDELFEKGSIAKGTTLRGDGLPELLQLMSPGWVRADLPYHTALYTRRRVGGEPSAPDDALFVISRTASVVDFCLFWSLRATRMGRAWVWWLPAEWFAPGPNRTSIHEWCLTGGLDEAPERQLHVSFTSATMSSRELAGLVPDATDNRVCSQVTSLQSALYAHPDAPDVGAPDVRGESAFWRNVAVLDLPHPEFISPEPPRHGLWAVDVEIDSVTERSAGLRLPQVPGLANDLVAEAGGRGHDRARRVWEARVDRRGRLCVGTNGGLGVVRIAMINGLELADRVLEARGFAPSDLHGGARTTSERAGYDSIRRTEKGEAAHRLAQLMGGPAGVATLFVLGLDGALEAMSQSRPIEEFQAYATDVLRVLLADPPVLPDEVDRVADDQASKLSKRAPLDRRIDWSQSKLVEELAPPARASLALDTLVSTAVLVPGFRLKCAACGFSDWHSLDDVGTTWRCRGCSRTARTPPGLKLHYALEHSAARAIASGQHLPLAVAALLQAEAEHSFFWETELCLYRSARDTDPECDLDLLCVVDGRVIIGECDRSGKFSKPDMDKLLSIAPTVRAKEVILALSSDRLPQGRPEMRDELKRRLADQGVDLTVFYRHHLSQQRRDARRYPFFVGNPRTLRFHRTSCPYRDRIRWPEQRLDSIEDAREAGYRPCKACQPQKPADAADKPSPTR